MKQTKRELCLFSFYDHTGIAQHLEKMAAKGWLLEKTGPRGWVYRRTEPKQLHFAVTYFPKASAYDPGPSASQQTFQAFCEEAGWKLVVSAAQMQIFCNDAKDPIPMETDAAVQVANIHQAMKRNYLLGQYTSLLLGIYILFFSGWQIRNSVVDYFSESIHLLVLACALELLLIPAVELISYFRWYRRARAAAALDGSYVPTRSHRRLQLVMLLYLLAAALIWIFSSLFASGPAALMLLLSFLPVALCTGLTLLLSALLRRKKVPAKVNRALSIGSAALLSVALIGGLTAAVFRLNRAGLLDDSPPVETYEYRGMTWKMYADPLPLTIQDLIETDYDDWSTQLQTDNSPFLTRMHAAQRPRMDALDQPDLEYEIVQIKAAFLYEPCRQEFIDWVARHNEELPPEYWDEYRLVEQDNWGAEAVYQRYGSGEPINQFLLCWPDRIAEISFDWDWEITPELMSITGEKLKTA